MNNFILILGKKIKMIAPPKQGLLGGKTGSAMSDFLNRPRISETEKIIFAKRLAILIKAGIPIVAALEMLKRQTSASGSKKLIANLQTDAEQGKPLAKSAEDSKAFGNFEVNIIRVGEASGALAQNLHYLAGELQKRRELKRNIAGALVYPAFILIATIAVVFFLSGYVFPKILPIFTSLKGDLPLATKIMIAVSAKLRDYWLLILAAFFSIGALAPFLMKIPKLKLFFDECLLGFPLIGLIFKNYHIANSSRALCLLLKSQSQVVIALKIAGSTSGNKAYQDAFEKIAEAVRCGESIGKNMERQKRIFPSLAAQMVYAGETSGNLEDSLTYLAQMCEDEMNGAAKNLSVSIEPALMILMGLLVGFVAIAIITPIYGVTQLLQK